MPSESDAPESAVPPSDSWSGLATSLAFWLMLLLAAALFAGVSLSPKLSSYLSLQEEFLSQQRELVALEEQHRQLEKVIAALKDDPHFAAEMARMEFDATRPGEEILSVETSLALSPHAAERPETGVVTAAPPWRFWIEFLASNNPVRLACLTSAALLVLWAFGWMQDGTLSG